jgi:CTP:molybdopterin cytidylyltransferase MocA
VSSSNPNRITLQSRQPEHAGGLTRRVRFAGLVLAAGGSRRFGGPKQLAPLRGRPLLEHALAAATSATGLERVVVTLGARADEILQTVDLHRAEPALVENWEAGQAASLRAGVEVLAADSDAIVVLLGDQPFVTSAAIERVVAAWRPDADAARATFGGRPGHPVILGRSLFAAVQTLRGDVGARMLLAGATVLEVELGADVIFDVDTPEQLRAASLLRR